MAEDQTHQNLLAETEPATRLPPDPAIAELADHGRQDFLSVVRQYPASSLCWALLAEGSLMAGTEDADVAGYAYARTGYHRGLDALRKAGWKGRGAVPWEHLANQGFLRSLWALSVAADRIGEQEEASRCEQFLRDSSPSAWEALHTTLIPADDASADDSAERAVGAAEGRDPAPEAGNTDETADDAQRTLSEDVREQAPDPEDAGSASDEAENDSPEADPRKNEANSPEAPDDERPPEEEQDRAAETAAQPQG